MKFAITSFSSDEYNVIDFKTMEDFIKFYEHCPHDLLITDNKRYHALNPMHCNIAETDWLSQKLNNTPYAVMVMDDY